jgi:hypothetical protein
MFAAAAAEALGKLGDPQAVPALIQALGDSELRMFAVRQRRRWAQSATPKPSPRSSKHWRIIDWMMFAMRHDKPFSKSKRSSLKQNDLSFSGGCPMKYEDALPIEEWVRAARVYAAECVGWFAPALYAAPLHLSDALPAPAAIDRYGRVYFNPQWVARLYEACGHDRHALVRQLAQVWYHEVAHWLREHEARAKALHADARLWNLAADMEINDYLPEGMAYPSLGGEPLAVLPRRYNLPDGEIAEWYYQRLVERAREQAQAGGQQQSQAGGQQQSQAGGSNSRRQAGSSSRRQAGSSNSRKQAGSSSRRQAGSSKRKQQSQRAGSNSRRQAGSNSRQAGSSSRRQAGSSKRRQAGSSSRRQAGSSSRRQAGNCRRKRARGNGRAHRRAPLHPSPTLWERGRG